MNYDDDDEGPPRIEPLPESVLKVIRGFASSDMAKVRQAAIEAGYTARNTSLMEAAQDLLDACLSFEALVCGKLCSKDTHTGYCEMVQAAIAKAGGSLDNGVG